MAQSEIGAQIVAASNRAPLAPIGFSNWWPGILPTTGPQLNSIAVTPPLQLWHTFHTLELVYRDAYYSQLNDRYLGKWNTYKDLTKWAYELLNQTGLGIVADPIGAAQTPQLKAVAGVLSPGAYFVQVSWLNLHGEEGVPSPVTSLELSTNGSLEVTPLNAPTNSLAWNVYVGCSIESVGLQNNAPLRSTEPWTVPASGLLSGRPPGNGQVPNYYRQLPRYLQRG